jgi:FkbM family methyltransferase
LITNFAKNLLRKAGIVVLRQEIFENMQSEINQIPWIHYWSKLSYAQRERLSPLIGFSTSQLGQDLFAANEAMERKVNQGYFVEFGAANGSLFSNTWLLEKKLNWTGILAEPARKWHLDLERNRDCIIDKRCVTDRTGEFIPFLEVQGAEVLSGTKEQAELDDWTKDLRHRSIEYNVETISLNDLLDAYKAPTVIDYLSIDTEGGELEVLRSFDFNRYRVMTLTVEVGRSANTRRRDAGDEISSLMQSKGFQRKHADISKWDDWYVYVG